MRRRLLFVMAVLSVVMSCGEKVEQSDGKDGGINVSVNTVHLNASGVADTDLVITSDSRWSASVSASWLKLSPSSADSGQTTVLLSGTVNDSPSERTVDILIYSDTDSERITVTQDARDVEFSCTVSARTISFSHAYDYVPYELTVKTEEDAVELDMTGAPWVEIEGGVTSVPANTERKLKLVPSEPNYGRTERNAVILLVGRKTGESIQVAARQPGSFQDEEESLHNLWRLTSNTASSAAWRFDGVMTANLGDRKGMISVEASVNSNVEIMADNSNATVKGLRCGDALLMRTPVKDIPAGTDVTVMINISQKTTQAPREWVAEYWDDDRWNEIRKFVTCNESTNYNCATFIGDFVLTKPIVNDYVKVRFRMVSDETWVVNFINPSPWYGAALVVNKNAPAIRSTRKVLVLGNSFTYYWGSAFVLKQLARSQGCRLDIRTHTEGGISLLNHVRTYRLSKDIIKEGGYDAALLQEQSTLHSDFASGSYPSALNEAQLIAGEIRAASPSCRIILENTWSYSKNSYMGHGSYATFDTKLRKGCAEIAEGIGADISPINQAFESARSNCSELNLLHTDGHHPSRYGIYLKSCVNYAVLFGAEFNESPYIWELTEEEADKLIETVEKNTDLNIN